MYVQRLLQINMATLAALGALLLGMGQRDALLPLAVSLAAISSVWLTDIKGRFRLNRVVSNVGAVLAVLASLPHLRRFGGQLDILGIAQMLVYLQIILLFQQKDRRCIGSW